MFLHLFNLLLAILKTHSLFLQALELHDYHGRKSLAVSVVSTVVSKSASITSADEVGII